MTNPFTQAELSTESSFAPFTAFESAAPSALKEFPMLVSESRSTTSDAITQYDSTEPFEITDGDEVVASSCPCSSCPCCEYVAKGWNRNSVARNSYSPSSYSSCDDGSCDDGEDYDPSGDCDDGSCGPGGGLLRGLLGRFGRGGLFGRMFGGGGLGLARGFRL